MENKEKAENKKNFNEGNLPSLRKVKSGHVSKKSRKSLAKFPKNCEAVKVAENFFKLKQKATPKKASPPTEEQMKKLQILMQMKKEYAAKIKLVQELKYLKICKQKKIN